MITKLNTETARKILITQYDGDGEILSFTVPFRFKSANDLDVSITTISSDVTVAQKKDADYIVERNNVIFFRIPVKGELVTIRTEEVLL